MQRTMVIIGLLLIAAVGAIGQKTTPEEELRAIYKQLDNGMKTCNVEKVTQFLDAAYTLESEGKKMNRDEAIEQWRSILGFIRSVDKLETKIEKITLRDGVYLVDYSQSSSGKVQFPGSPVLPFDYTGKITDAWVKDKTGKWHNTSSVEHQSDFKVNGESAKPSGN